MCYYWAPPEQDGGRKFLYIYIYIKATRVKSGVRRSSWASAGSVRSIRNQKERKKHNKRAAACRLVAFGGPARRTGSHFSISLLLSLSRSCRVKLTRRVWNGKRKVLNAKDQSGYSRVRQGERERVCLWRRELPTPTNRFDNFCLCSFQSPYRRERWKDGAIHDPSLRVLVCSRLPPFFSLLL